MDSFDKFHSNKDISRSHAGTDINAAACRGSNITMPAFINTKIKGNVYNIHNAPGVKNTGYRPRSEKPQTSAIRSLIVKHKTRICSEYQYVTEYNSLPGEQVLLSERFTQPLILQKHRDQKEREEELRSSGEDFQQVLSSKSSDESVHLNSLFNPDHHGISPSAVILQGNSGNGKSFTVQKIMMDWASDKLYKEQFDIVFHLKCKEINRISDRKSLVEILSYSCSLTSDEISQILQQSPEKVLFIIDGFDELKLTQGHNNMSPHTDLLQKASPEVTLCTLLRGRILPESFLLVTTRSTATDKLTQLLKGPQRFSEIMGFTEKGVEEYFQKFFQDEELFRKAYTFVKPNETLFTACSIPVICWIICTTIKERFKVGADVTSGLETTTSIYFDFVSTLLEHHCQDLKQSVLTVLRSLGQLAERGMLEQQVLFDKKTVYETVSDPAGNPFLCKFLFKRKIHQETMFSFMHLSFQEFFTALYCLLLDEEESQKKITELFSIGAVNCTPHYSPPRFGAVVQFAFGLLNKDVRRTLRNKHGLVVHPNTEAHLKKWISTDFCLANRTLFAFHCLYELHEDDFVKEVMEAWDIIDAYGSFLRRTDCWALLYCSQCCQSIKEMILVDCSLTPEKLSMILPALPKFKKLWLTPEDPSDSDVVKLIIALMRGQCLSSQHVDVDPHRIKHGCCSVRSLNLSISEGLCRIKIDTDDPGASLKIQNLTFPHSELTNIDYTNLFQMFHEKDSDTVMSAVHSFSKLKKMEIKLDYLTEMWSVWTLQIIQNCPSLTELVVHVNLFLEEGIKILQRSCTRPDCIVTFDGFKCNSVSQNCSPWGNWKCGCDHQEVKIYLSYQGFSEEILRRPLFGN
ncbi:NACHT, LRR and PYD domains-containing protein 1 homolog [Labeo rohita]|uniref:NACHT, LRR and PYD domains-containing protein 1 homolog n=1 Tax=Labeo rohita TaxID=84645 RepID=UPI0021E20172|nr:NACHT, LRR and PYD domains-containing protein 1 homolog [Labeo rohita]